MTECFGNIFHTFVSDLQINLLYKLSVKFIMTCSMFTRKGINFANQHMEFIVLAIKGAFDKLLSNDLDPVRGPS